MDRTSGRTGKAWTQALAFWLLLLSIVTHAVVPGESALARTTGSAFGSATVEVAIPPGWTAAAIDPAEPGEDGSAGDPPSAPPAAASLDPPAGRTMPSDPDCARHPTGRGAAAYSARAPPSR